MNSSLRRIAVSGSAAVALLGGAAAITTATADTASATDMQTAVSRAAGAPVAMPDGRVVHVRGLDNAAYRADAGHSTTVVQLAAKADTQPGGTAGIENSLNGPAPQGGVGNQIQQPGGYNPQQVQTQAGGGAIGVGIVAILLFVILAIVRLRADAKKGDALLFTFLGVALGGTVIGTMISQITSSGIGSLGGVFGGL